MLYPFKAVSLPLVAFMGLCALTLYCQGHPDHGTVASLLTFVGFGVVAPQREES